MTATTLAMFPGQGSQHVGMGRDLLDLFPDSRLVFEEAEDAARISIRKLCLDGPEADLKLTANTQPCLLTVSVAYWRVLRNEVGIEPHYYAGHSLGEYSALVASGRLDLSRAAYLVRKRGEAMQAAVPEGQGAMAAVMNLDADELARRCGEISREGHVVEVVNYNSPQQLVVAGHKTAVDELGEALDQEGVKHVALPVSAPFHSSLMKPARDAMEPLLGDTVFEPNGTRVIANLTGKLEEDYDARFLIDQINNPVRWSQSLQTAYEAGCRAFIEIGPGKVLFGLARKTLPRGDGLKLIQTSDIQKGINDINAL